MTKPPKKRTKPAAPRPIVSGATRAAMYLRVSTRDQTLENQTPDLERLAKQRGLEIVEVYQEQVSAVKKRPEFERMLEEAHRGRFSVLLVWAIDRFGRSMVANVQSVIELDRRGVQVVSFREPWLDTGGPVRPLLIAIFSWVAEQERSQLIARTRAGIDHARRKGIRIGRPRVRFDEAKARALIEGGSSLRAVARALDVPLTTLARALKPAPNGARSP